MLLVLPTHFSAVDKVSELTVPKKSKEGNLFSSIFQIMELDILRSE